MTPIVGLLSDKFPCPCGKRTFWYIFGTLLVIPTFTCIWIYPDFVNETLPDGSLKNETLRNVWYITLPAIFNVGWASVQISNMAVVNELTRSNRKRDQLANNRNGFTAAANILVLALSTVFFFTIDSNIWQYRALTITTLVFGTAATSFYLFAVREKKMERDATIMEKKYRHQEMIAMGLQPESLPMDDDKIYLMES